MALERFSEDMDTSHDSVTALTPDTIRQAQRVVACHALAHQESPEAAKYETRELLSVLGLNHRV